MNAASFSFGGIVLVGVADLALASRHIAGAGEFTLEDFGKLTAEAVMLGLFAFIVKKTFTDLSSNMALMVTCATAQVVATKELTEKIGNLCENVVDNHHETVETTKSIVQEQQERTKKAVADLMEAIHKKRRS